MFAEYRNKISYCEMIFSYMFSEPIANLFRLSYASSNTLTFTPQRHKSAF